LEHQERFTPVFRRFGQADGFGELFDGDRLAFGDPQHSAVGEPDCLVNGR
jgi:hypothetical protein